MNDKRKTILTFVGFVLAMILLIASAYLAEYKIVKPLVAVLMLAGSIAMVFVSVLYLARMEHRYSKYVCRKCGHTFKPTFKAYLWGAHTLTTRHLKCPECGEKSWGRRKSVK